MHSSTHWTHRKVQDMSWHAIASSGQGFGGDEQSQTSSGMGCGMPANVYDVPICAAHVPKNVVIYFYPKMRPDLQIFLNFLIHLSERCIVKPSNWSRFVIPCASVLQAPRESLGEEEIWEEFENDITLEKHNLKQKWIIFQTFFEYFDLFWILPKSDGIEVETPHCAERFGVTGIKSEDIKDHLFLMQILLTQRTKFITCTQII